MNTPRRILVLASLFIAGAAHAQSSALTYQGSLTRNGDAVTGTQDFEFRLFNAASGGAQQGPTLPVNDLGVTNGLFTVALDFGAAAFPGTDRWLEIATRPGTNTGAYTTLHPRQPITSTPYAVRAANLTGTLPQSQLPVGVVTNNGSAVTLSGSFTGNGAALSNVNAATLNGVASSGFWRTNGNAGANPTNGAFLGSSDNLPVEFKVNGARALRLEPTANGTPNIIAGSSANSIAAGVFGATISGGGNNRTDNGAAYATIAGGQYNVLGAGGYESTIGGGYRNTIETFDSTIGGGAGNTVETNSQYSTIAGGTANRILAGASLSAIGGGSGNLIASNAPYSAIPGGVLNTAGGQSSFAAGYRAKAMHQGGFVWADSTEADFASTGSNQFLIRAASGVGINTNNANGAALAVHGNVSINGVVSGNGAGLSNVPSAQLTGNILDSRLSPNVALRAGGNYFTGSQVLSGGNLSFGDAASSLQFPSVSSASSPMLTMFAGGFANANRMVLAHSPAVANWGLQYQDATDQFDFLANGSPVMTVALGSRNVGVGTLTPQSSLHVYSANNPTVVRVQSAGAPGFGRLEFFSNPQGDANEWRPGYIQSLDAGGFTGGLGFYVNGTGAGSKFGSVEGMRLLASGLHVNTSLFATSPSGNGVQGSSGSAGASAVYGENTGQGYGVSGRTTGAGYAIYGDNANPAGWAGVFNGNLYYSGLQNKLDVMENFTATVRAADFLFGHSTRHGAPGRALVDLTDTLYLNFASDWANTYIGGNNVSVCTLTIRGGCDIAEPFQMTNKEIPMGAVVVIDEDNAGHLKMSDQACDRRVAGIISGANGVNTGVTLTQEGVFEGGQNVALSGRVYVQADAGNGPIKPGDLLTTSDVPGHAMKVTDHAKAQGAILGKAMTALKAGRGMVLVLVTLQ